MVKKSRLKNVPRSYIAIGVASLLLNAIFIGVIVVGNVLESSGSFDYATVNSGIDRMCSEEFRETIVKDNETRGASANESGMRLAVVDYPCSNNGAQPYYEKGFREYAASLGLKP